MSAGSPVPPDGRGADALSKGVSGDPGRFSTSERDVDCPSRRSLPGEEVRPSEETSLILLPLTTEKAGRDSTPQPSGGPAVTRCPERWRDKAPLPAPPARRGKQRLGSTASVCRHQSCKSTASHIQEVAGDDRCAHCALACLFCEFLALCSLALDGLGCGALCLAGGCCTRGDPPGQGCGGRQLPLWRGVRAPPGLLRLRGLPGNLPGVLLHLLPRLTQGLGLSPRTPKNPTPAPHNPTPILALCGLSLAPSSDVIGWTEPRPMQRDVTQWPKPHLHL